MLSSLWSLFEDKKLPVGGLQVQQLGAEIRLLGDMWVSFWIPTNREVTCCTLLKLESILAKCTCHLQYSSVFKAARLRAIVLFIVKTINFFIYTGEGEILKQTFGEIIIRHRFIQEI